MELTRADGSPLRVLVVDDEVNLAELVAMDADNITESDHLDMAEAGFTQDEIWDIGAIAAFFGMSNRLVNMADIPPNEEFYMLGREPRT